MIRIGEPLKEYVVEASWIFLVREVTDVGHVHSTVGPARIRLRTDQTTGQYGAIIDAVDLQDRW